MPKSCIQILHAKPQKRCNLWKIWIIYVNYLQTYLLSCTTSKCKSEAGFDVLIVWPDPLHRASHNLSQYHTVYATTQWVAIYYKWLWNRKKNFKGLDPCILGDHWLVRPRGEYKHKAATPSQLRNIVRRWYSTRSPLVDWQLSWRQDQSSKIKTKFIETKPFFNRERKTSYAIIHAKLVAKECHNKGAQVLKRNIHFSNTVNNNIHENQTFDKCSIHPNGHQTIAKCKVQKCGKQQSINRGGVFSRKKLICRRKQAK